MDTAYLKWSMIVLYLLLVPLVIAGIGYLMTPNMVSNLLVTPGATGVCSTPVPSDWVLQGNGTDISAITDEIINLCSNTRSFFSNIVLIVIVPWSVAGYISGILASAEVAGSNMDNRRKLIWVCLFIVLGFVSLTLYYFSDRKKIKRNKFGN